MTAAARLSIIALWTIGLLISGILIRGTKFSTDMSAFLPRSPNPAQQILVDQLREGVVSRLILVAVEGADQDTLAAMSKAIANNLRAVPEFGVVNNGDPAAFDRDRDVLWRARYLLSPAVTPEHFTEMALHAALVSDAMLLNSDLSMLAKRTIPSDPTGEILRLATMLTPRAHRETWDGVWMSSDHRQALLMAQTSAPGFDLNGQEQAINRIQAAFETARQRIPSAFNARLIESGPPVFAVQTRNRMRQDIQRLSAIATLLVIATLVIAYRSTRVLALAMLPVLTGVTGGLASVSLAFGFVHGITLGFGITLIGEAVDYAIYLFSQTPRGAAPEATLKLIWPTLRLGMLTSLCGFSAMLFSSFIGFAQLGLFTIAGLLIALAVTRWVLPALLPVRSTFEATTVFAVPLIAVMRMTSFGRLAVPSVTVAACLVIVFHPGRYWENELESMSPLSAAERHIDDQLRHETGAPDVRYLLVDQAPDREQALAASERIASRLDVLVAASEITGFDFPGRWLPSVATQKSRQSALPAPDILAATLTRAITGTDFREDSFAPFLADVAKAAHQPLLRREDLDGTNLALRVDSLLLPGSGRWTTMLPLEGVADANRLANLIKGFNEPNVLFLDLRAESNRLFDAYLREALTLSGVGGIVIVALLTVSLRSMRRVMFVTLPLVAAVVSTAALLLVTGGVLSIFNLFGLLLVVAVGSNYCLFFERQDPDGPARRPTVASLVLANLCTVIGFGVLSFSRFPVLHGIGLTVAIGAFLCLVFGAMLNAPRRVARIDP